MLLPDDADEGATRPYLLDLIRYVPQTVGQDVALDDELVRVPQDVEEADPEDVPLKLGLQCVYHPIY